MAGARYKYKPHPQEERIFYVKKTNVETGAVSYGYTDYSRNYNPLPASGVLVAEDKQDHHRILIKKEEAEKVFKEE